MMIRNSRAALCRFDKGRHGYPQLPNDPGTVHALLYVTTQAPDLARLKEPDYIRLAPPGGRVR